MSATANLTNCMVCGRTSPTGLYEDQEGRILVCHDGVCATDYRWVMSLKNYRSLIKIRDKNKR